MFNNIGKKIKNLAKILCWISIIIYVLIALAMFLASADSYAGAAMIAGGIAILIVGPLLAWIGSFFTYGFGELIDKACDIEKNTRKVYL